MSTQKIFWGEIPLANLCSFVKNDHQNDHGGLNDLLNDRLRSHEFSVPKVVTLMVIGWSFPKKEHGQMVGDFTE